MYNRCNYLKLKWVLSFNQNIFSFKRFSYNVGIQFAIFPISSYGNADLEKVSVIKENKGKSGIYRWINTENNKSYTGSSIDLGRRFKEYYNYNHISNKRCRFPINNALLKYGYSKFKLEILEYCDKSNLIERKQYYIDNPKPEYNVLLTAGSNLGFKHSES